MKYLCGGWARTPSHNYTTHRAHTLYRFVHPIQSHIDCSLLRVPVASDCISIRSIRLAVARSSCSAVVVYNGRFELARGVVRCQYYYKHRTPICLPPYAIRTRKIFDYFLFMRCWALLVCPVIKASFSVNMNIWIGTSNAQCTRKHKN